MNLMQAIATCMGKYVTFSGRASRSEFWWFYLFTLLMSWGASLVGFTLDPIYGPDVMSGILSLIFLLPLLAVATRRLHDVGRSGWWQLLYITIIGIIVLIIWWASKGQDEANSYGPAQIPPITPEGPGPTPSDPQQPA